MKRIVLFQHMQTVLHFWANNAILLLIMVVRMRHTRAHRDNRRSHHALENPAIAVDKKSGVPHLRHRASLTTGEYHGRQVIDVQAKLDKRAKKAQTRKTEGR